MGKYDAKIAVVAGIRKAFEKFKHHAKLTKRVRPYLEEELPGYTVYLEPSMSYPFQGKSEIGIWGNSCFGDIPYNNRIYVSWYSTNQTWQKGLLESLAIADCSDSKEREQDEEALYPQLEVLEKQIKKAKEEADKLIANLPIPKSATFRKEPFFWKRESAALREKFPLLFGVKE